VPEGDTIAWAARRIRPVLEGQVPEEILTPHPRHAMDRWPDRLGGRTVTRVGTHGKHLFLHFEGDLVLHSHLAMSGAWGVYGPGRRWGRSPRRAWLVIRNRGHEVVEFDGPTLELMTEGRVRFDQRLACLGPDVLAPAFDAGTFLARLRADDQTRTFGDALLDQRNVAGLGNIWKAEGCWLAGIDPWRRVADISDAEALVVIEAVRPPMQRSAEQGPRAIGPHVYRLTGHPCPRCGTRIAAQGQGDANRTTYWCPGCQS
jgi:endonuclease-8